MLAKKKAYNPRVRLILINPRKPNKVLMGVHAKDTKRKYNAYLPVRCVNAWIGFMVRLFVNPSQINKQTNDIPII